MTNEQLSLYLHELANRLGAAITECESHLDETTRRESKAPIAMQRWYFPQTSELRTLLYDMSRNADMLIKPKGGTT